MNDKTHAYFRIDSPHARFIKLGMIIAEEFQKFSKTKKPVRRLADVEDLLRKISTYYSINSKDKVTEDKDCIDTLLKGICLKILIDVNEPIYELTLQTFSFFMRLPKDIFQTEYTRFQQKELNDTKILKTIANRFLVDYEECEYYANALGLTCLSALTRLCNDSEKNVSNDT